MQGSRFSPWRVLGVAILLEGGVVKGLVLQSHLQMATVFAFDWLLHGWFGAGEDDVTSWHSAWH
jgi:hypothetical protein